jgi:hypothetical protein
VALVDSIAHGLADEVTADGTALEIRLLEQFPLGDAIAVVGERLIHFEMVTPAGQLQALIAEAAGLASQVLEREVGPLTGNECNETCHVGLLVLQEICVVLE